MVKAITTREFDYTLLEERGLPEAERTVFQLRRLTAEERFKLQDGMATASDAGQRLHPHLGDMTRQAILAGLLGWHNLTDEQGRPVEFKRSTKSLNVLGRNCLPPEAAMLDYFGDGTLAELAAAIQDGAVLSEDDAGN